MHILLVPLSVVGCGEPTTAASDRDTGPPEYHRYYGPCRRTLEEWCDDIGDRQFNDCPRGVALPDGISWAKYKGPAGAHYRCIGKHRNWRDQIVVGLGGVGWVHSMYFGGGGRLVGAYHFGDIGLCVPENPKKHYYSTYSFTVDYGRYPLECDEQCVVWGDGYGRAPCPADK